MSASNDNGGPSELIIEQGRLYHLGVARGDVAPNLIVVGDPARAYRVAERFDAPPLEIKNREFVTLTGAHRGLPVSVIGTGIGTDNIEIALVESYAALAFDLESVTPLDDPPPVRIIRVGTSGGAQPDISSGTLVVTEYAIGLDSTALYFDHQCHDERCHRIEEQASSALDAAIAPGARFKGRLPLYAVRASSRLFKQLSEQARRLDSQVASGITVTAPGFYGASSRYVAGLRNTVPDIKGVLAGISIDGRRVLNFEMESSLLFHLGAQLGIECCTICPVISQPGSHAATIDYAARIERAIEIALATLCSAATAGAQGS